MRIYDYLNGIRGALGSGEDTGVPAPAWRIEEYLKDIYDAIKAGGGGGLVVTLTINTDTKYATADKTAAEIWAAAQSGVVVFTGSKAYDGDEGTFARPLMDSSHTDSGYGFSFGNLFDYLFADTGSDYPAGYLN